ncbi:flagellin [Roseateles sp.]|jgi:flagellin|uniref:flagellin N-terminal helical domain-containing protein n=1 Tax=Roseateles sp. TaxID=1971397 RepID=UPI0037C814C8
MPQTINTNIASLNAQRNLNSSQGSLSVAMQRLSSGLRVNSAKDDAAGLAIAERMNTQVRGMTVAMRNANDGISLAQTAEGALGKISDALQRMRELTVQSRNATNSASDKDSLDKEFQQLAGEITRIMGATSFNGKPILNDPSGLPQVYQIGANTSSWDTIDVPALDLPQDAAVGALIPPGGTPVSIGAATDAGTASSVPRPTPTDATGLAKVIDDIDDALTVINNTRATFGAVQSRFDAVISNLQISVENQSAARSRIMDADYAAETSQLSRAQILQQAGNAMVAQANQLPQQVLSLLRGG